MEIRARICLMGSFELWVDGQVLGDPADKSKKGAALLQYLILQRGEPVPTHHLIDTLWADDRSQGPENALKTLVSRLRASLNHRLPGLGECIGGQRGAYRFHQLPGLEVDLYEVEELLDQLSGPQADTLENRGKFEKLLKLYGVGLLPEQRPDWANTRAETLEKRYVSAIHTYLAILIGSGEEEAAQTACLTALEAAPNDQQLQMRLLRYAAEPQKKSAPPEDKRAYYDEVLKTSQTLSQNLEELSADIKNQGTAQGALLCDYQVFREIYTLNMRNLERMGTTMYLALIRVSALGGVISAARQEEIMQKLGQILRESLRKGDTISQMNANTYALLLPTVDRQSSVMVLERLKRAFGREFVGAGLVFAYRVAPVLDSHPLRKGKGKNIC